MKKSIRKTLLILLVMLMGLSMGLFFTGCGDSCSNSCGGTAVDRKLLEINEDRGINYVLPLGKTSVFCYTKNYNAETDIVDVYSSDEEIAIVEFDESSEAVKVTALQLGEFEILIEGESENSYFGNDVKELFCDYVEIIELSVTAPTSITMTNGSEKVFEYSVKGYDYDDIVVESLNEEIVTIENGVLKALKVGTARIRIVATLADSTLMPERINCTIVVTDDPLEINKTSAALQVGESTQLSISGYTGAITWTSSDPEIASVNNDGKVTAKAIGTATITATGADGRTATCTVDVSMKQVAISLYTNGQALPNFVEMQIGQTLVIEAVVDNSSETVTWTADNEAVSLEINGNTVTVTGVKEGIANLAATIGDVSVSVGIDVEAMPLPDDPPTLDVNKTEVTIDIHGGYQLIVIKENTNEPVTFKSADETIATVDTNGLIRGATKTGTTTVTVTCGEIVKTVTVIVEDKGIAPVCTMNLEEVVLGMGGSIDLIANVTYEGIKVLELDNADWMINDGSDTSIIDIQEKSDTVATITGKAIGETIVKYQYTVNGIPDLELVKVIVMSDSITTTLKGTDLKGDDTNGYTLALSTVGETYPKSSTVTMEVKDGDKLVENPIITWASSNEQVATVANGVITAKGAGTAIISAKYQGFTKNITVTVTTGEMIISGTVLLERYNPVPIALSSEIEGDVTEVTLNDKNILVSYNSDNRTVVLNAKPATTLADLGKEVTIKFVTSTASYVQKAIVYSKIIRTATDLDTFGTYAANETYDEATGQNATLNWTGHFIIVNDISYNGGDAKAYESFGDYLDFKNTLKDDGVKTYEEHWWESHNYGFRGIFDGQGYNIDGMRIAQIDGQTGVGFISNLHTDGVIKNMSFTNFFMPGWGSGLSNSVSGTIQDIYMHISWIGAGASWFKDHPSAPIGGAYVSNTARISRVFIENERANASAFGLGQTELNAGVWKDAYYVGPLTNSLLPRHDTITDPSQGNDVYKVYNNWTAVKNDAKSGAVDYNAWVTTNPTMWEIDASSGAPIPAKLNLVNNHNNVVALSWNNLDDCIGDFGVNIPATAGLYNMTYKMNYTADGTNNVKFNGDMVNRYSNNVIVMIDDGTGNLKYARAMIADLVITSKADLEKMGAVTKTLSNVAWQWAGTVYLARNIEYNANYVSPITYGKMYEIYEANKSNWPTGYGEWDSRVAGFFGTFDGCGFNINGLKINETAGGFMALLSGGDFINNDGTKTWKQGVIKNVTFTNAGIHAGSGFLCCDMSGLVQNVIIHANHQAAGTAQNPTGFISAKNTYAAGRLKNVAVIIDEVAATDDTNYMYTTALGTFWDHISTDKIINGVITFGNNNGNYNGEKRTDVPYLGHCGQRADALSWSGCTCASGGCPNSWSDGAVINYGTTVGEWIGSVTTSTGFILIEDGKYPTTYNLQKMGWDGASKAFVLG